MQKVLEQALDNDIEKNLDEPIEGIEKIAGRKLGIRKAVRTGDGGIQHAAENALKNSGKFIPWQVVTITRDGKILDI